MKLHKLLIVVASLTAIPMMARSTVVTNSSGTSEFWMDFGGTATPLATGFRRVPLTTSGGTPIAGPGPTTTLNPQAITLANIDNGKTYSLNFIGTFGLWTGSANPAQPLTSDGWYFTIDGNTFSLTGLSPGDRVSMWGTLAWDGAGRAAGVRLNSGVTNSFVTGNTAAGLAPTKSDMVLVTNNMIVAGTSLNGQWIRPLSGEGQFGGLIFDIQAIPEPSTVMLLLVGSALTWRAARRRR